MSAALVSCVKCTAPLPANLFNFGGLVSCPGCGNLLQIEVFPALFKRFTPGQAGEAILETTESSCFYHPEKKAVLPCEACGRFMCALCDCELNGQHLCPTCLDTGKRKGKIKSLENHRSLHDSTALALTLVPLLLWPVTFITAPAAIFIAIRHWNTPTSVVHRTKIRFIFAILFAALEIAGWLIGIGALMTRHH